MNPDVMRKVQQLRDYMGQPLILTSAYRCPEHPIEAAKVTPGQHSNGLAVDIYVTDGYMAAKIIAYAIKELDVKGFAYNKENMFIHLDWRTGDMVTWNY
ncbi:MAG: peptidase M15A [Ilumatobacteraceae bacterium]|nr:peptidase M15A [Ilumatobacteraceae bacterium]